jgi:YVTN family beta-propeller protein
MTLSPTRRSPTVLLGVLVTALSVVTAGCGGSSDVQRSPAARSGSDTPSSGTPSASPAAPWVTARVALGSKPCGIQVADGRVWVSNYGDATVQWIDAATGRASAPVRVGAEPCGIAVGDGSVWVEDYGANDVTRIDQRTGTVQATIGVGEAPYDVTYSHGAAWVTDYRDGTVSRIDAATNRRRVVEVGGTPAGIAPVAGGIWVPRSDNGTVVRIDARTGRVTNRLHAGAGASWTAYSGNDLWVSNGATDTVTRIDARTRRVVATVKVGPKPLDGVVVDGRAYIPTTDGRIYRIDPATDAVTSVFRSTVSIPFVITGTGTALWAADFAGTEAVRIDLTAVPPV